MARSSTIHVDITCTDESGGNVYAMVFEKAVNHNDIETAVDQNKWWTRMVELTPYIGTDNVPTVMSCDITRSYANLDDTSPEGAAIIEGVDYYLYLYLKDVHDNHTVYSDNNPLLVNIETTVTFTLESFHIDPIGPTEYAKVRSGPPKVQSLYNQGPDERLFAFYERDTKTNWRNALYADITIVPHESVVGNVYNVATETAYDVTQSADQTKLVEFVKANPADTLVREGYVFQSNVEVSEYQISKFYPNVDTPDYGPMRFNNTYHVYTVLEDKGFGDKVVRFEETVTTGAPPVLSDIATNVVTV